MNVTVKDIRNITPGCTEKFQCDSPEAINSAQTLVWYCNRRKSQKVWKYITKSNWDDLTITITAISADGIKTE